MEPQMSAEGLKRLGKISEKRHKKQNHKQFAQCEGP